MSKNSVTALGNVPKDVQQHVRDLLSITPSLRPDVHQMSKVGWLCKSKIKSRFNHSPSYSTGSSN